MEDMISVPRILMLDSPSLKVVDIAAGMRATLDLRLETLRPFER
jgi:hypothetical protein